MRRMFDTLRRNLAPLAIYASGHAIVWYALALLASALWEWWRHG